MSALLQEAGIDHCQLGKDLEMRIFSKTVLPADKFAGRSREGVRHPCRVAIKTGAWGLRGRI